MKRQITPTTPIVAVTPEQETNFRTYSDHIESMARTAHAFMKANHLQADIKFRGGSDIMVIGTVPDAVKAGFLTFDKGGGELLKAMGAFEECPTMPSVFMVKCALEFMDKIVKEEKTNE